MRQRHWVAVLFVALALRLLILPLTNGRVPVGDPANYVALANSVIAGHGFIHQGLEAHYPPLYPMLLSVTGRVLPLTATTFLTLNFAFDVATAGAMVWLSRLMGVRYGSIAAAIYLLWPTNLLMAPIAHKEGLTALLVCLSIGMFISRRWVAFGLTSGLLILNQPALAPLPALLALALRSDLWRDWARHCAIGTAAAVAVMLPWWVRNYLIFHQFVPLTDSGGWAFWIGTFSDRWVPLPPHLLSEGNGVDIGKAAWAEALAWARAHPVEWLQHNLSKALAMLKPDEWHNKPLAWMTPYINPTPAMRIVPAAASAGLFLATAIGLVLVRCKVRAIILAGLIQLFAIQLWFEFPERHRYFMIPLMLLLAAQSIKGLSDYFHREPRRAGLDRDAGVCVDY